MLLDAKSVWSHVASASRIAFEATASVACAVRAVGRVGNCPRIFTRDGTPGHIARGGAASVPRIHIRTERWAQNDRSAVRTLWPTPGTTISLPCGNWSTTVSAFETGVRMSKPPLTTSTGTLGSGPGPSGVFPAGDGQ